MKCFLLELTLLLSASAHLAARRGHFQNFKYKSLALFQPLVAATQRPHTVNFFFPDIKWPEDSPNLELKYISQEQPRFTVSTISRALFGTENNASVRGVEKKSSVGKQNLRLKRAPKWWANASTHQHAAAHLFCTGLRLILRQLQLFLTRLDNEVGEDVRGDLD